MTKMTILYFMSMILMCYNSQKFLIYLITIELMMIMTSVISMIMLNPIKSDYMIIYILVCMVSESVLGLTLLIMMSRIHKSDMMSIMEMKW